MALKIDSLFHIKGHDDNFIYEIYSLS